MNPLKIAGLIYKFACYALFILNLVHISGVYFRFSTDVKVARYVPLQLEMFKVSLCFNLDTLLTRNFNKPYIDKDTPRLFNQTSKVIFESVPRPEKLLAKCHFRDFERDVMVQRDNSSDCCKFFDIQMYRMHVYMCYLLTPKSPVEYDFYSVTHSFFEKRHLFQLTLNEPFTRLQVVLPMIHFTPLPSGERIFSQELILSGSGRQRFDLSYYSLDFERLPHPYDTNCGNESKLEFYSRCMNRFYRETGLSPLLTFSRPDEPFADRSRIVHPEKSHMDQLLHSKADSYCHKMYIRSDSCVQKLVVTLFSPAFPSKELTFGVNTVNSLLFRILHLPKYTFIAYITEMFNLTSIWLGLSILTLINASKCMRKKSNKNVVLKIVKLRRNIFLWLRNLHVFSAPIRRPRPAQVRSSPPPVQRVSCKKMFSTFNRITVWLLLFTQLFNICKTYLQFETTLKIMFEIDSELESAPQLALCFSLSDHLKVSVYPTGKDVEQVMSKADAKLNLTIEQIFGKIQTDQVLGGCRVRRRMGNAFKLVKLDIEECLKEFNVRHFIDSRQICLMIEPKKRLSNSWVLKVSDLKNLLHNPGVLYSIIPHESMKSQVFIDVILFFVHENTSSYPFLSKEFSATSVRTLNAKRMQLISYHETGFWRLPWPYDTKCRQDHSYLKYKCFDEMISKFSLLPSGIVITNSSQFRIIGYQDLKNETISRFWQQLEAKCSTEFSFNDCQNTYTQTFLSQSFERSDFSIEFVVTSPKYPRTLSNALPRMSLYDLFYQINCTLSFWLGFYWMAIEPHEWSMRRKADKIKVFLLRKIRALASVVHHLRSIFPCPSSGPGVLSKNFRLKKVKSFVRKKLFFLICFIGCTINLLDPICTFLTYPIIIENERKFESQTNYSLTLCPDTVYNISSDKRMSQDENYIFRSKILNLTTAQILRRAPSFEDSLMFCRIWGEDDNRPFNDLSKASDRVSVCYYDSQKCRSFFKVKKLLLQSEICYSVHPKRPLKWNRYQLGNTFNFPKVLFMIAVKSSFLSKRFSVVAHEGDENVIPNLSILWSSRVVTQTDLTRWHVVSYRKYRQTVLPPPYSDDGFTHMLHMACINRCINRKYLGLNLTYSTFYSDPNDMRFITHADRMNDRFNKNFLRIKGQCIRKCKASSFNRLKEFSFSETEISEARVSYNATLSNFKKPMTQFYLRSTDYPVTRVIFKPQITIVTFIINITSVICLWFGISMIALNPFESTVDVDTQLSKVNKLFKELKLRVARGLVRS